MIDYCLDFPVYDKQNADFYTIFWEKVAEIDKMYLL